MASDDQYGDEETERRAREAIRRSFQTPYKPQKEIVGKVGRSIQRKPRSSKTTKKPK
jgi:hypothetical protein